MLHLPAAFGLAVLHGTWIAAFLVGGGVSGGAYLLARRAPGAFSTRAFIALGFAAYGALLVDQAHGLIEMHFYFFASLAFLLVYRDWRVILVAAGAIAVHHLGFMVLQQAGAPVWVMPHAHLEPRHGRCCTPPSSSSRAPCSIVLVALDGGRDAGRRAAARRRRRRARAARRAGRRAGAPRPERPARAGDGAAAILRAGIGQVATLVETIQSTALEIASTSQQVSAASAES